MISVYKKDEALTFQIGPHTFPASLAEAVQLRDMIKNDGLNALLESSWSFGSWKIEPAGAYDHAWEKRQRVILHYGHQKWHLTHFEMEFIADEFSHQLHE